MTVGRGSSIGHAGSDWLVELGWRIVDQVPKQPQHQLTDDGQRHEAEPFERGLLGYATSAWAIRVRVAQSWSRGGWSCGRSVLVSRTT
jgi:hypothetical protein